ncbi:MAG: hypothetical protein WEB58_23150 [Planctomycetaceae bacterium]
MTYRKRWYVLGSAAIVFAAIGIALPGLQHSNCGGNSSALAACKGYVVVLQLWADEHDGERFDYEHVDDATRQRLRTLPGVDWISPARLLAKIDDVRVDSAAERHIIMVCDRPFDNVPQRMFGRAPLTHAVAYSTGETGLISTDEFARLDLGEFVPLIPSPE